MTRADLTREEQSEVHRLIEERWDHMGPWPPVWLVRDIRAEVVGRRSAPGTASPGVRG